MSRRYYGIEEIAESILKVSNSKDKLKNKFIEYANASNHSIEITDLFHNKYGYNKKGEEYGRAISLISKYAYFITGFNFPIYDSIVMEVYPLVSKGKKLNRNFLKFIKNMKELLESTQVKSFNKLDNLLWLIGKIRRGNYSLILSKDKYRKLVENINLDSLKSDQVDKAICKHVVKNIDSLSDVFTDRQTKMINFSNELTKTSKNKI